MGSRPRAILRGIGTLLTVGAGVPFCFMLAIAGAPHMLLPVLQRWGMRMLLLLVVASIGVLLRHGTRLTRSPNR